MFVFINFQLKRLKYKIQIQAPVIYFFFQVYRSTIRDSIL